MRKLIKTFDYGTVPNSYDILKVVALVTMIIDHIGYYLFPENEWFRVIGRIAFPIFLFLVGFSRSYKFDLWLFGAAAVVFVSQGINGIAIMPLNILFAIVICRMAMRWLERRPKLMNDVLLLWVAVIMFYLPTLLLFEYGTLGIMFAMLGWWQREGRDDRTIRVAWLVSLFLWVTLQSVNFGFAMEEIIVFTTEMVLLGIGLSKFTLATYKLPPHHDRTSPTLIEAATILIARNTLLLYVLHVVALQIAAHYLFPDVYNEFFLIYQW